MENNHYNNPYTQPDQQQNYNRPQPPLHNPGLTMATVSMILGLGSIFTLFTVYLPLILGSIAVLFAILSKGYGKKMVTAAKVGMGTAIGGLALVITVAGMAVGMIFSLSRDSMIQFGQAMDQQFEEQTGMTLEDVAGQSYEELMRDYAELFGK